MVLRIAALVMSAVLVWTVAGSRVAGQERLPLAAIVPGAVETLPFGCTSFELEPFDPFCPGLHIHTGVDLAAPAGTPVMAAAEGIAQAGVHPGGAGIYGGETRPHHRRPPFLHLLALPSPPPPPAPPR